MTIVVVSQHVERAQNYSPPTSFSVNKLFPMFVFHAWSLAHPQAKVVQSWKGVASAMHTATVQSVAENATLTAENTALKSRKRELEAQAHDLQCIVVAAVAERDQLPLKHKALAGRAQLRQPPRCTVGRGPVPPVGAFWTSELCFRRLTLRSPPQTERWQCA